MTVDKNIRTVLQMPRGNLEGIYPRIIVLQKIIELIDNLEYGVAFRLLRQHKIDINMIYDVNPEQFMANIEKFVSELEKVDYLNLFINSLNEDDRGKELEFMRPVDELEKIRQDHMRFMLDQIQEEDSSTSGKVNRVCEALKAELVKRNENNRYLLPILTIYVKKQPQELKQVLDLIREMQQKEKTLHQKTRVVPPHLNPETMKKDVDPEALKVSAKDALEYVSWLVNPNVLFDVALTTYDFELVTLVATQTQKDPKEYVAYLQKLKDMEEVYMKFKIQTDLKRYEEALQIVSTGGEKYFKEALELICKQRLFKQGITLY